MIADFEGDYTFSMKIGIRKTLLGVVALSYAIYFMD